MAARMPVRSLPAVQWNTAGRAPGSASRPTAVTDRPPTLVDHGYVALGRRPGRSVRRGLDRAPGAAHHIDHGHVVHDQRVAGVPEPPMVLKLVLGAKVDDRPQPQPEEHLEVRTVQPMKGVGAVQRPPAHSPAVVGLVAAEVAEVEAGIEPNQALGERRHVRQATDGG